MKNEYVVNKKRGDKFTIECVLAHFNADFMKVEKKDAIFTIEIVARPMYFSSTIADNKHRNYLSIGFNDCDFWVHGNHNKIPLMIIDILEAYYLSTDMCNNKDVVGNMLFRGMIQTIKNR